MKKQKALFLLCILLFITSIPSSHAGASNSKLTLKEETTGVSYTLSSSEPYLYAKFKHKNGGGSFVIQADEQGMYQGELPLTLLSDSTKVELTLSTLSLKRVAQASIALTKTDAPLWHKPQKNAVHSIRDFTYTFSKNSASYRFTAPGHTSLSFYYRSVSQSNTVTIYPDDQGVFSGEIPFFYAHPNDLLTTKISTKANRILYENAERIPFFPPPLAQKGENGPLTDVTICIDPGHQGVPILVQRVENWPGSGVYKPCGSTGMARGITTRRLESIVALEIAYDLYNILSDLGADVIMTRMDQNTARSNIERAEIANNANADYFLRIHLNYRENNRGKAVDVYMPNHSPLAQQAQDKETYKKMGEALLSSLKTSMCIQEGYVHISDQFIGNNWAKMPAFLIEAGYMSTPKNDLLASYEPYRKDIAQGIANGVLLMEDIVREKESAK